MFSFSKRGRRLAGAGLAAAVAATLSLGLGAAAQATGSDTGNINPDATGTVTIHKYSEASDKGANASGHEDASQVPEGASPLQGVVFTAYKITDIDLTTNAGWDAAGALDPGTFSYDLGAGTLTQGSTHYALGAGTALPATDAAGLATSGQLGLGAYLFVETDSGDNNVTNSAPFVVTVPLPDTDGSWNYDIHVYPKNSLASVTKDVNDKDAYKVGDTITWPVTVGLPYLPEGQGFDAFSIVDTFDPALTYAGVSVKQGSTTFAEGTDYAVTQDGQKVTVTFNDTGRGKLAQGQPVVATFSTTVNDSIDADSDGIIPNQAFANVNDSKNIPSNKPQSKWGGLQVHKYAAGDSSKALAGAEFDVKNAAGAVVGHLTTGNDGNSGVIALKAGDYTLVETKAPNGYEPISDPIPVTVVNGAVSHPTVKSVENVQKPAVTLPLTGGAGTLVFTLAGLALVGGAAGIYARSRRSRA